jgi:radical SAM protein with 4Fe4S-binding SPASM domain
MPNDPDAEIQHESVVKFLEKRGLRPPNVLIKFVGGVQEKNLYEGLPVRFTTRSFHVSDGNYRYNRKHPLIPESMLCADFLGRPAIDWQGRVFQCVKLDVDDSGYLGDLRQNTLDEIWNSEKRLGWMIAHKMGRREITNQLCANCDYWGIGAGAE